MATFLPLKQYMFYCLDQFIEQYNLRGPFLDIGCGIGDVSVYLGAKGWSGKAIDFSPIAIEEARRALRPFPNVSVEKKSLADEETGGYQTILLWDIIEHIEDDRTALAKATSLLAPDGMVLIAVPSNPREWRWDDEMVGHYRRYTVAGLTSMLQGVGLEPLQFWDFTFPVFWSMRRGYTRLNLKPRTNEESLEERTKSSAVVHAWHIPLIAEMLKRPSFVWRLVYMLQFNYFRYATERGHEFLALARKAG